MTSLNGKRIIVVGGSSGIGFGVAAAALESGAQVAIAGRSADRLKAAEQRLAGAGRVTGIAADMANEADVARLFDAVGAFDHLVATAGPPPPNDPIGETDMDFVRQFVDGKLIGAVMLAKHAVRTLNKGGSMTFTSGINKDRPPVPGGSVVSAIAGSFTYFARALALELAPTRVNIVSPGWVDTEMWDEIVGEAKAGYFDQMGARIPAGRVATPADVAPAYLYLMQSQFMTGETIHIDGGQRLV
ncbi:SDR family oxidoreductase [Mesorhizobium sp. M1C.F.Ca.ET.193.01.1.1]|nr:SDR family oxidoreductase [Mesorhizobium sp. M1C.F.Ca.ET.210.01.1.1]TGQ65825.1 SDR family oxidoreductase [Mesorhizobium sp. M1C.F.Ca.ET.212.01.1.1]TGQ99770.1 SDR family oxidoreductase [Mesorhizobium sp. M1C.F.Ca.ET.204.01.1.1]TGR20186.1 SDR family oxidoreductase [Mesorhizobium sp. M1C.F.Ca.ET.196.01.1.1]TGR42569.1 SDR family oxidoreductase [Mesorhizobium sp. M1C.F.Ca.ET.195.01.1.1]TGR61611.1 SDR family oxidoreductase [Mesorhizobium sp. M1C.F.Ca.ET.192.01.1.1]TGR74734.1 SDR family oxidoredu